MTQEQFDKLFIRKDGLNHILLSDVNKILDNLALEFPDVLTVQSIG